MSDKQVDEVLAAFTRRHGDQLREIGSTTIRDLKPREQRVRELFEGFEPFTKLATSEQSKVLSRAIAELERTLKLDPTVKR